ncbi:hypothetical protein CTI14_45000, partial [Methylobacterium radiotolerans]
GVWGQWVSAATIMAEKETSALGDEVGEPDTRGRRPARAARARHQIGFAELLAKRGLGLRTDLLRSLVHWVTPDFAHRRFDTRYFAATLPVGQTPTLLPSKGVWGQWVSAATIMAEKETSALGDEVGEPDTRG